MCVDRFPASLSRARLLQSLNEVADMINATGIHGDIWIDGSFVTEKLNPDDVDLILIITAQQLRSFDATQRTFFNWFRTTSLYNQYRIDNYTLVRDDSVVETEYFYAYWLRQFGFSRGDEMKGLAVIRLPYLVTP